MCSYFLKLNKAIAGKNEDKRGSKESSRNDTVESGKTAVVFSLKNEVGGLVKALRLFQVNARCPLVTLRWLCAWLQTCPRSKAIPESFSG